MVFPEEFDIAEQARMYREADVVAGFAGSGLLGVMFAPSPKRVIMLAEIPKNPSGKILKKDLRTQYRNLYLE